MANINGMEYFNKVYPILNLLSVQLDKQNQGSFKTNDNKYELIISRLQWVLILSKYLSRKPTIPIIRDGNPISGMKHC